MRAPVSVEAINGFIAFAKDAVGLTQPEHLREVLLTLSEKIHPLVLGDVCRSRAQIRMLAKRLLQRQITDEGKITRILDFLCSESGSHDYTIHRQEAQDDLGLQIEKPDDALYNKIKAIYDDFAVELHLGVPYSPDLLLGAAPQVDYFFCRALIESSAGGIYAFLSEGHLTRQQVQMAPGLPSQIAIQDRRNFEGWRHTDA